MLSESFRSKSIFSSDARKKRRYGKERYRANGSTGGNGGSAPSQNRDATHALASEGFRHEQVSPMKFRKWGDEIVIAEQLKAQKKFEESHPTKLVLAYPSIAPPLPMEYK